MAGRYVLLRELGVGGMGSVHLAQDLQTGEAVALKKLSRVDPKSVLRFKREFRSLAHTQLPNLVRLYDLECERDGTWFLTMEYVPGSNLVAALRPPGAAPPDWTSESARVFSTFGQLARGVSALHGAGMLHRDLKPSNVIVADDRVWVLDFGLIRAISESDARVSDDGMVSGTPAYMAPEQASGDELSEATDWYAFGVMLYEVLAGDLPFDGPVAKILREKIKSDPTPLAELEPDAPRELTDLCMALLRRDPAQRPTGAEVLERLGASQPMAARAPVLDTSLLTEVQSVTAHFVGRSDALHSLQRALSEVARGQTVAVHVRGMSGAGKSALLERFLSEVEAQGSGIGGSDVLVLRSRCYEREAMPFKALDSIMDALVSDLSQRDELAVGHLLPADIQALTQLFPVLERVPAVKKLLSMQRQQVQARSYRQRAEVALRELFGRLAQARPLIVWVDDLHWGDLDSVSILRAWLEQHGEAPFLLLLSYRSDEVDMSPALRALLAPSETAQTRVTEQLIEIGALAGADMRALCGERLGKHALGHAVLIDRIVEEAHGNPFLASQLASLALAKIERGVAELGSLSIEDLVTQTREFLPPEATNVLAVLAVAGRPMAPKLALRVAGVRHGGRAIVHALRNMHLVRTRDSDTDRMIEVYHDRIREHVYRRLTAARLIEIHAGLLRALEHSGRADADWLHSLALGAGDRALALQYGLAAAERARTTLAWERAAELYTACLELCSEGAKERAALWESLGLALACSGHGVRAAEAFLNAATLSESPNETLDLKRTAAAHFVGCGRFEQGDALFEEVMAGASIHAPRSEGKLIAAVVWERCRLGMRGLAFQRRTADQVAPDLLARIDLLENLRMATIGFDALRSTLFATQSLRLALDAGEPTRVARALTTAATIAASQGNASGNAASQDLLSRAQLLVTELATPRERLSLHAATAATLFYQGHMREVLEPAAAAAHAFRELPAESVEAAYFLKFAAVSCRIGALSQLDYPRFRMEFLEAKQEALATENVHALLILALNETICDEFAGQAELSMARLEAQRALLPRQRFTVLHVLHMAAVMYCACATGAHSWGFEHVAELWPLFMRSPLRRIATLRNVAHMSHGRLLLNAYARTPTSPAQLRDVSKDIEAMMTVAGQQHERLVGRVAYLQGDHKRALAMFSHSAENYASHDWRHESLRDRYAIGRLTAGEQGEQMVKAALEALEQEFGRPNALRELQAYFPELVSAV